jgi:hypothetical protein
VDRAPHRLRGFLHRGTGRSGMVHELGPPAGLYAVRHLPDHRRHRGVGLGNAGVASFDFPTLAVLRVSAPPR